MTYDPHLFRGHLIKNIYHNETWGNEISIWILELINLSVWNAETVQIEWSLAEVNRGLDFSKEKQDKNLK